MKKFLLVLFFCVNHTHGMTRTKNTHDFFDTLITKIQNGGMSVGEIIPTAQSGLAAIGKDVHFTIGSHMVQNPERTAQILGGCAVIFLGVNSYTALKAAFNIGGKIAVYSCLGVGALYVLAQLK